MEFNAFKQQAAFLRSNSRIRGAFAGRRGGKTEVGAIDAIIHLQNKIGYKPSDVDPYIGVVISPTTDMLRRLSIAKILGYSKPFHPGFHKTHNELRWPNGSVCYGISADKPERLEGIKANFIWIDEVFQVKEQIFLESLARVADTQGKVWCTGSLGTQYTNPKNHWAYKRFKEKPLEGSEVFEWATAENPYFPKEELERLKDTLDPITYRQLFEISWDSQAQNLVYSDFTKDNEFEHTYNPQLETYVSIDWGYAHELACLYFQYNPHTDTVYLFDEIVSNKTTLEQLWAKMSQKAYKVNGYICDIAGTQERELTGISNVRWFKQHNIHFKYRASAIAHGIAIVRSYILNSRGQRRFYINPKTCPKSLDGFKNYSYAIKDGMLKDENPIKKDDDAVDSARYFFVNRLDFTRTENQFQEFNRWTLGA